MMSLAKRAERPTKQDQVIAMLRARKGTTVAAIGKTTGWQPHSVRGFFSAVVNKKLGLTLRSDAGDAGRVYRIVGASKAKASPNGAGAANHRRPARPRAATKPKA